MLRTATRFLLLRFLPRRILPLVTVVEAVLLIRSLRRRPTTKHGDPADSQSASSRSTPARRGRS